MAAVYGLFELAGKQLEARMVVAPGSSLAESLTASLPDQALEGVLGIGAQKPGHGKDDVDQKCNRSEAGNEREERHPEQCGSRR